MFYVHGKRYLQDEYDYVFYQHNSNTLLCIHLYLSTQPINIMSTEYSLYNVVGSRREKPHTFQSFIQHKKPFTKPTQYVLLNTNRSAEGLYHFNDKQLAIHDVCVFYHNCVIKSAIAFLKPDRRDCSKYHFLSQLSHFGICVHTTISMR